MYRPRAPMRRPKRPEWRLRVVARSYTDDLLFPYGRPSVRCDLPPVWSPHQHVEPERALGELALAARDRQGCRQNEGHAITALCALEPSRRSRGGVLLPWLHKRVNRLGPPVLARNACPCEGRELIGNYHILGEDFLGQRRRAGVIGRDPCPDGFQHRGIGC